MIVWFAYCVAAPGKVPNHLQSEEVDVESLNRTQRDLDLRRFRAAAGSTCEPGVHSAAQLTCWLDSGILVTCSYM